MMMEAVLAVDPPGNWINALRDKYDISVRVLDVINTDEGMKDLVEIVLKGPGSMSDVVSYARELPMISSFEVDSIEGKRALAVASANNCRCCQIMQDTDCFLISASTALDRWIEWVVIFTERSSLQKMFFKLEEAGCKVKLKRISNIDETKMLTPKQEEIIRTAYVKGYYDFPKKVGVRELADMFEISTATVSEILRRGQKKIIERYLDLRTTE